MFQLLIPLLVAAAPVPSWQHIDALIKEQKFEAAAAETEKRLEAARGAADVAEHARALIKLTQLRMGSGGAETAVKRLKAEPWPRALIPSTALNLYYAAALANYYAQYSYEIRQREKVDAKGEVDLKAWSAEQIWAEFHRVYGESWKQREELGTQKLGALKEYLTPNGYPPGLRDTLRDVLTYSWARATVNTSSWTPDQAAEVYRLDFKALIAGNAVASAKLNVADQSQHPLVRACALYDDLEAWHQRLGQREAALEARLQRLASLWGAVDEQDTKTLLIAELEGRLAGVADLPWSAAARAQLAQWYDEQGERVKARQVALEGMKQFKDSIGAARCRFIVANIEAPEFQVTSMQSDGPARRSLEVTTRNLSTLYFRAYRSNLRALLASRTDYRFLLDGSEMRTLLTRKPDLEWTVTLPATPDFKSHRTFVTPPLKANGLYELIASARSDFADHDNQLTGVNLLATPLTLVLRQSAGRIEAQVFDALTGEPVPDAEVELYSYRYDQKRKLEEARKTGADGAVMFEGRSRARDRNYYLLAKKGPDDAFEQQGVYFFNNEPNAVNASLIYTDRSVYRPQQKVLFKVVAYKGNEARTQFETLPATTIAVQLIDPNYQTVETRTLKTNKFGTAFGEFVIPTGRLLGNWQLQAAGGSAVLRVEEYKRPTFEVTFKDQGKALKLNAPATLVGEARYYFGLPVTSGQVKWQVRRTPEFPWWWGHWGWASVNTSPRVVAVGSSPVKADGTFEVTFTPDADARLGKDVSYHYEVQADLTDDGGETRSATKVTRLGYFSVETTLSRGLVMLEGKQVEVTARRADLDGNARPGVGRWRLSSLEQPSAPLMPSEEEVPAGVLPGERESYRTPGDAQYPRWRTDANWLSTVARWKGAQELKKGTVTHDAKGESTIALGALPAGAYRLEYDTTDEFGQRFTTKTDLLVGNSGFGLKLPGLLKAEREVAHVGETVRFLCGSGFPGQPVVIDVYRAQTRVMRKVMRTGAVFEWPVTANDRGGFSVQATLVRDWQLLQFSETVDVPWDDKELKLEFATLRDTLRPGAKETFRVTVKGKGAALEAGAAEVLAYMYDKSLDLFAPHTPPSVVALYAARGGWPGVSSSLGEQSGQQLSVNPWFTLPGPPSVMEDQLEFFSSYAYGGLGVRGWGSGGGGRGRMIRVEGRATAEAKAEVDKLESVDEVKRKPVAGATVLAQALQEAPTTKEGPAPQLRSNFSATAFFSPQLVVGADGAATFEFTVPDSVTAWNVWAHAVTNDMRGGSVKAETRSVKDLMVRPYLPRFLREGDEAQVKVVVNNASRVEQKGELSFEVSDPDTGKDLNDEFKLAQKSRSFTVKPGEGTTLTFNLVAPKRVGVVAVKVVAKSGDFSDGELRPLPLLPSRMHLAQSRFVTLRNKDSRTMTFADLANSAQDKTLLNEQLVVTVDAQLFFTVLKALPYLMRYPYECTEQTLNRFLSAGIVSSVFRDHPAVAKMGERFAKRGTPLESFDALDPNRKLTLEESPWLLDAQGVKDPRGDDFINLLDPKVIEVERASALAKLKKAQVSNGGFPWWSGGPPSFWMTLYLTHGFAKATEFKVDVPKDTVQRAWTYLGTEYRSTLMPCMRDDRCWESITFLNYVASAFPDESWLNGVFSADERKAMLDFSFKHWKQHSPFLKAYLALTLKRAHRDADARLVFESVMDSSKTTQDDGTFWQPEDRAWLWYNDTIESHAFALRALTELQPNDRRRDGLVQWLLINKKLNQWKSTRATAEVIYSLVKYLQAEKQLGVREESNVTVGPVSKTFTFAPDEYAGRQQLVVPGAQLDAKTMSTVTVSKETKGFQFASATWHFSTEQLPKEARGDLFQVSRTYFKREKSGKETVLKPLGGGARLSVGDEVEVQLSIRSRAQAEFVHLRDPRAAGFEPENAVSRFKWNLGLGWYEEYRDSGTNFFFEALPAGEFTFKYRVRASMSGTFKTGPATLQSMYAPEFTAYSQGNVLAVDLAK